MSAGKEMRVPAFRRDARNIVAFPPRRFLGLVGTRAEHARASASWTSLHRRIQS